MARKTRYQRAVEWIAYNDEPNEYDEDEIAGFISTCLVADMFGKDPMQVAQDICAFKERKGI